MVSQITPPSSSPTHRDHVQPNAAALHEPQHNDWPGSSAPPPKRRRKAPPVIGELDVVSLLDDDLKCPIGKGLPGPPHHSELAQHNTGLHVSLSPAKHLPSGSSRSGPRALNPAKALAKAAANGPVKAASIAEPQAREATCVSSMAAGHDRQGGWAVPPLTNQTPEGGQPWGPPLLNVMAPPPHQPTWNATAIPPVYEPQKDFWMNHSNVDLSPVNPFFQQWYPGGHSHFQPQEQSWSWPPRHSYEMPPETNIFAGYTSPTYQMPATGTAARPIVLDDEPVRAAQAAQAVQVPVPTAYAPQPSQFLGHGTISSLNFMGANKENTTPGHFVAHVPTEYQQATTCPQNTGAQPPQTKRKKPKHGPIIKSEPESPPDEPQLCPEQAELVSLIEQGHNVFYTGSAGCGKSTVLKAFVKRLRQSGKQVRIIAPTGRAALNVGGSTTWTFAGWTPSSHKLPIDKIKQGAHGKSVYKRLIDTDVLVIDEISMVENLHLERLNILMKTARYDPKLPVQPAFGGCQIVVTGDFCQLPPVKPFQHCLTCGRELTSKVNDQGRLVHVCKLHGEYADEDKWAFRSKAWDECGFVHFHLKTIHRQNDKQFIRMLQKCRLGHKMKESEISLLMDHKCRVSQATKLYSTRREANDVNRTAFNQLKGVKLVYWCHDSFLWRESHPHLQKKGMPGDWGNESEIAAPPDTKRPLYALEDHRWAKCVQLKRGMLVVLLTNLDLEAGLCNGSQGVICSFENYDPKMLPMKETINSRGQRKVEPQPGQRIVRGEHAPIQEAEIKQFITSESAPVKKWPVVQFHNGVRRTVYAECSINQLGDEEPYSLLARTQIPLAPAWAMTIHKSQSLTLDRVIVNLSRAFEDGQVYVALSRATGLGGLKIEGDGQFLRSKLMVNAEVTSFLKEKFGDIYDNTESEQEEVAPR
ncbi:hypothetical protein J7T55_013748 [Diaporthe amygdali]|uniref:uncharacterized protein n=1 Tax=Phomopsis amygdali TaxID=1214568 RepID=UPI0022FDCBBD|nr:uncharacterized protein J7T55_013748 [Diaporthe amygdali]KAJ0119545.1 hypothetical protein J7T55_013748 [Diaporthe amygdali]